MSSRSQKSLGECGEARRGPAGPGQEPPSTGKDTQEYLGQEVLVAAESVVESLDQQRLHMLEDELGSCIQVAALLLWLWGRLALGRICRAAVGTLGSLGGPLTRTQVGVSEVDGFSFLLSAA